MKKKLSLELVQLKYEVLKERINKTCSNLKYISKVINCENEIKSIDIIKEQYEKMYQEILQSGEYEKYEEVENTIILKLSQIEAKLDRYIYKIAKTYVKELSTRLCEIKASDNYKNFDNLDELLNEIRAIKNILKLCTPYISQTQLDEAYNQISQLKFEILLRKQIAQIIYKEGGTKSAFKQYDNESEKKIFEGLFKMEFGLEDAKTVMENNDLLIETITGDMEKRPLEYLGLLHLPIFKTQEGSVPKVKFSNTDRATFLRIKTFETVLSSVIKEKAGLIECKRLYEKFELPYSPEIDNGGQAIIWKIWEQVQHTDEYFYEYRQKKHGESNKYTIHQLEKPIICSHNDVAKMRGYVHMNLHVHISKQESVKTFYWVDSILISLKHISSLPIDLKKLQIAPEEAVQDAIIKKEEIDNIPKKGIYASCYLPISYIWPEEFEDKSR